MKENQFLEVMRKHSDDGLLEVLFVENVLLKFKRTIAIVLKTMLLLEGFVLLCSCNSKKSSSTILLNDSHSLTTLKKATNTQKGIIETWYGEAIRKPAEKVLPSNRYDKEAVEKLRDNLWLDVLMQYNRNTIMQHFRQYHNAVNDYLNNYINAKFYTQTTLKSLELEELEFSLDTFRIDETCRLMMLEIPIDDNSILGYCYLYRFYAEDYLIYKYYIKIEEILKDEDRNKLRLSQEQWESSLNADWELENTVMNSKYTGGGSIWKNLTYVDKRSRSEFLFRIYKHLKACLCEN